jgi:hypothetical protein
MWKRCCRQWLLLSALCVHLTGAHAASALYVRHDPALDTTKPRHFIVGVVAHAQHACEALGAIAPYREAAGAQLTTVLAVSGGTVCAEDEAHLAAEHVSLPGSVVVIPLGREWVGFSGRCCLLRPTPPPCLTGLCPCCDRQRRSTPPPALSKTSREPPTAPS